MRREWPVVAIVGHVGLVGVGTVLTAAALIVAPACSLDPLRVPETQRTEGGGLQPALCNAPSQCPGADTACRRRICVDGFCDVEQLDGPLTTQVAGDCHVERCSLGELVREVANDPPDDANECTVDRCLDGSARHEPVRAGTPCGEGNNTACDDRGSCQGCQDDSDCPSDTVCGDWSCHSDTCVVVPAPLGTACGDVVACANAVISLPDACDGAGACDDGGVLGCAPYACAANGLECRTTCLADFECSDGYECLIPGIQGYGECVPVER